MALVTQFICHHCNQSRFDVVHQDGLCQECRSGLAQIKRDAFTKGLDLMPLEARVRRLEGIFYDLDADSRLKALEAMNARY